MTTSPHRRQWPHVTQRLPSENNHALPATIEQSVMRIIVRIGDRWYPAGSAAILSDGYVLTMNHVATNALGTPYVEYRGVWPWPNDSEAGRYRLVIDTTFRTQATSEEEWEQSGPDLAISRITDVLQHQWQGLFPQRQRWERSCSVWIWKRA